MAKLKQQALACDVHPDNAEECVDIFVDSLIYSGLAIKAVDDKIQINPTGVSIEENPIPSDENQEDSELSERHDNQGHAAGKEQLDGKNHFEKSKGASNINVNIDVDPSMDPEKLEKLLKLLKKYGAI